MSIISIVKAAIIKEKTMIDHWFELDERLRFITMASLNMVLRYLIFILLSLAFGSIHYQFNLLLMWLLSSFIAFYSYKKLVFDTQGNHLQEYLKSISIWTLSYFINAGLLSLLVGKLMLNLYLAQGIAISFLLVINYLLFKHFAFSHPHKLNWWEKLLSMFDIIK